MHWHGVKLFFVTLMQLKHTKSVPTWARAGAFGLELVFNYFNTIEKHSKTGGVHWDGKWPSPEPKVCRGGRSGAGGLGEVGHALGWK